MTTPLHPDEHESFVEHRTQELLDLDESYDDTSAREEAETEWAAEMAYRERYLQANPETQP
jgi:hypothetical protein